MAGAVDRARNRGTTPEPGMGACVEEGNHITIVSAKDEEDLIRANSCTIRQGASWHLISESLPSQSHPGDSVRTQAIPNSWQRMYQVFHVWYKEAENVKHNNALLCLQICKQGRLLTTPVRNAEGQVIAEANMQLITGH